VQWQHSTGISFLGVDGAPTLDVVRRFAEAMHYTGQLSFDFVDRDGELFIIECNPRSTDGILLVSAEHLAAGITDPSAPVSMVEPGTETQLDFASWPSCSKSRCASRRPRSTISSTCATWATVGGTTCRWSGRSPRSCTAPA